MLDGMTHPDRHDPHPDGSEPDSTETDGAEPDRPRSPAPATGREEVRTLTEAEALAALANPVRARMMDALTVDGPSTASMLAARTGQAVGSASHHLKVLARAGLVEEAPEQGTDRRQRWWRPVSVGTRWSRADLTDPAAEAAAEAAEALILRRQTERVQEWMADAGRTLGWQDAAFMSQFWLHLSPDELDRLGVELTDLLTRWKERPVPDDGAAREPVYLFARGFPSQP